MTFPHFDPKTLPFFHMFPTFRYDFRRSLPLATAATAICGGSLGRVRSNYAGAPGVAACGESLQQGAVLRGVGRRLPSGNLTLLLKMTIYSGFSENGDFP